jgi:hypothetical protein
MTEKADRYLAQASYATPTGRAGGATFSVWAKSLDEATAIARKHVSRNGRTKIDLRVTHKPLNWP